MCGARTRSVRWHTQRMYEPAQIPSVTCPILILLPRFAHKPRFMQHRLEKSMNRILTNILAVAAVVVATPTLAWTVYPDVDFEWYANVGKSANAPAIVVMPAPREGYIWAPAAWQSRGSSETYVAGHWIKDDYEEQVALYNSTTGNVTSAAGSVLVLDRDGNIIPTSPQAYPVDSATR